MEEATYLTKHRAKVTLIHRRDDFRASKIMLAARAGNPKIDWLLNTAIEEILGEPGQAACTGVRMQEPARRATRRDRRLQRRVRRHRPPAEHRAVQGPARHGRERLPHPAGTTGAQTATKIPGVFAAGDVADHVYRQAITAAGTGCMAAIDAERFLSH